MLIGLYQPTSGTAYLAGHDVVTETEAIYQNIGVCPQHDIQWDDLTCLEHLLFYGRLRGIAPNRELERARAALKSVNLSVYENRLSKTLSGGERRRLSLAIALLDDGEVDERGNSTGGSLCFLDEVSTGLDPAVRREIWQIIMEAKKTKTIILTSHDLVEVELLASRIAILSKGVLRCVGTALELK